MRVTVFILVLLISAFFWCNSEAGVCTRNSEFYLECLEGKHEGDRGCHDAEICFWCIGIPNRYYKRWALAAERKRLREIKEVSYRDRLVTVAINYLDDPLVRDDALCVLAFQGITNIGSLDIFEEIVSEHRDRYDFWYVLAGLQDPRTVQFAEGQYFEIRNHNS